MVSQKMIKCKDHPGGVLLEDLSDIFERLMLTTSIEVYALKSFSNLSISAFQVCTVSQAFTSKIFSIISSHNPMLPSGCRKMLLLAFLFIWNYGPLYRRATQSCIGNVYNVSGLVSFIPLSCSMKISCRCDYKGSVSARRHPQSGERLHS